jgi:hypothetical protein
MEILTYGVFLFAALYCIKVMLDIAEIKLFKY